jgi:hypothetical protein
MKKGWVDRQLATLCHEITVGHVGSMKTEHKLSEERASKAKLEISTHFNSKQQVFLDFVLSHYVSIGVEELDQTKLAPLLKLRYHNSINDAVANLGEDIGEAFTGFQRFLYSSVA